MLSYVKIFRNCLNDTLLNNCNNLCSDARNFSRVGESGDKNTKVRSALINTDLSQLRADVSSELYPILNDKTSQYLLETDEYATYNPKLNNVFKYEPFSFLKYPPGCFYVKHSDEDFSISRLGGTVRQLSYVFFINDNFSGGLLKFPTLDLILKPEKNTLVIFPSNWCFPHEVSPVLKGTRHSVVTWGGIML